MLTKHIGMAALFLCAMACSGNPAPAADPNAVRGTAGRRTDVITAEELADPSISMGDALDAVRRLRPGFLLSRGAVSIKDPSAGSVHVSIDGGTLVALSSLSQLRANQLAEIRYLSAADAAQRFGVISGSGGVIMVKSK